MSDLAADVRHAFRGLRRSPWFAGLAVATLAVGIGGTTALFSMVNAVLLRALPFAEPDRLVEIWGEDASRSGMRVPEPIVEALRARSTTLAAIAIHGPFGGVMATAEGAVDVRGERVSANFTTVNGVAPVLGRGFLPQEGEPGAPPVMLVAFPFWQKHLGGDPAAVGRTIYLESTPYTIVGVMPPGFRTTFRRIPGEFWTPHVADNLRELERNAGNELVARLAPGATVADALRESRAIAAGVATAGWGGDGGRRIGVVPLKREVVGDSARGLQLLLAAAAIVLAIACINLAQLLLSRADARAREFATRKAVGAGGGQLFRLALVESVMVSGAGGLAGLALASWWLPALVALAPADIPRLADAAIDGRVLAFALALSLVTGVVFGTAPAAMLARRSALDALRGSHGGRVRGGRMRTMLVVVQVAASVALVALAILVGRTFITLLPSQPGFEPRDRFAFMLSMVPPRVYRTPAERIARLEDLSRRVAAVPGVVSTGLASNIPFGDDFETAIRPGGAAPGSEPIATAQYRQVSAGFFTLMQMPLLRGRAFSAADGLDTARVAIVNQRMAAQLDPGGNVLGRRLVVGRSGTAPPVEIVGVIADARSLGTTAEPVNEVYVPLAQGPLDFVYLMVQSTLDAPAVTAAVRREVRQAMPGIALRDAQSAEPMEQLMREALAAPRLSATLFTAMSALAMLLAAIGLFGMVAYSVSRRIPELGIRAALGARPRDLVATTARSAIVATAMGVAAGLASGLYLTRFVRHQLYAVDPFDVPTFAAAALLMLAVAALASFLPARRAAQLDPMAALRHE